MLGDNYQAQPMGDDSLGLWNVSLEMRLDAQIQRADRVAADLKRAQEILKKNPEIEEMLDILRRLGI